MATCMLPKVDGSPIHHRPIADRFSVIKDYLAGDVMDIGCVDARTDREGSKQRIQRKPDLLFRRIAEANPDVLGVDIDEQGIQTLREHGFNAVCADGHTMDLGRQFDTIIAGEIIEHLENPGQFLRNMRRHLKPDGVLILSTPNAFSAHRIWKIWRHGAPSVHEDHTCWFDPITLNQLLKRSGLQTFDSYWVQPPGRVLKTWQRFFRGYFCHHFMVVARPDDDEGYGSSIHSNSLAAV